MQFLFESSQPRLHNSVNGGSRVIMIALTFLALVLSYHTL
jgi:hypothetical protein